MNPAPSESSRSAAGPLVVGLLVGLLLGVTGGYWFLRGREGERPPAPTLAPPAATPVTAAPEGAAGAPPAGAGPAQPLAGPPAASMKSRVRDAIARGAKALVPMRGQRGAPAWSWGDPGMDALICKAVLESPAADRMAFADTPWLRDAIVQLAALQDELAARDPANAGAVFGPAGNASYVTALCLQVWHRADAERFARHVTRAQDYLVLLQADEGEGFAQDDKYYGGWGYERANSQRTRCDLNNTTFVLEALSETAGGRDFSEVWKKAQLFARRTQNSQELNADAFWTHPGDVDGDGAKGDRIVYADDGGAMYIPGENPTFKNPDGSPAAAAGYYQLPDGRWACRSYGNMTYNLMRCYLVIDEPAPGALGRALNWVGANYTVERHAGFDGPPEVQQAGVYYYYMTMAKALWQARVDRVTTPDGARDWRADLIEKLLALQTPGGFWTNGTSDEWWEGYPTVATPYAILALSYAVLPKPKGE